MNVYKKLITEATMELGLLICFTDIVLI